MDILVTGSKGFLGKIICEYIKNDSTVFELPLLDPLHTIRLDKVVPAFSQVFDVVLHIAGKAHFIGQIESEKQEFFDVNVLGTKNLLQGLINSGIPRKFVFFSSVSVYGKDFGSDIDENTPLAALDPSGASKIEAERVVSNWCLQHNVICTILRLPLIVGHNAPGNLGSMISGIQKGYYFNIAGGRAKKSMVLGDDIAKYILRVAEIGGVYNLTDGYHPSFEELSNHISIQFGKKKPMNMPLWLARILAKFGDLLCNAAAFNTNKLNKIMSNLTFDDTKAIKAFGWKPTPVLMGFRLIKK
jgi:nucleoside-diphosphate-sugar epimerase